MLSLHDLNSGATLLAPSYLHPFLRQQLLTEKEGILGIRLHSLQSFLRTCQTTAPCSPYVLLFEYRQKLKEKIDQLSIYQKTALSASFLKECRQLIRDMKTWDILPQELPVQTPSQQELAFIIAELYPMYEETDANKEALRILQTKDASHIFLYDALCTPQEQKIYELLLKQGAKLLQEIPHPKQDKQFFHAVNKRQELEACAQYIITHKVKAEDVQITLADSSYAPLLCQIFERYGIPHTLLSSSHTSIITKRFSALLHYAQNKNTAALFACIDCGCFSLPRLHILKEYLEVFPQTIKEPFAHLQSLQEIGHVLREYDVEKLKNLQKEAEQLRQSLLLLLLPLLQPANTHALLSHICELVKETVSDSYGELSVYKKIQDLLSQCAPYLKEEEDISFLLPLLEDITDTSSARDITGAIVTSLTQACPKRSWQFLLGATQKNYPAFSFKSGIFNESYYELLPYPSLEQRNSQYLSQLEKLLQHPAHLIVSYPLGTYEGKALEAALEIEQMMPAPSSFYPLLTSYQPIEDTITLDKKLAQKLYLHQGVLHGSISALERYIRCPFSYFARYALSLQEPITIGFSDSYMGTLAHYVLETLIQTRGKQYTKAESEEVKALLHQEIRHMKEVFPALSGRLSLLEERIHASLMQTLQRLDDMEAHFHLDEKQAEVPFTFDIPLEDGIILRLKGIIDRLDSDKRSACILDYKSSAKTLSEKKVFSAQQLQLLTYSIVIAQQSEKEILGAYYISLKNENIHEPAGTLKRRPVSFQTIGKEERKEAKTKAHRLNGWTMSFDTALLDDDARHITGFRINKDGIVKNTKTYDLSQIKAWFLSMYQQITERILSGDISLTPCEDACLFCHYQELCRFKGLFINKPLLVEPDERLYLCAKEEN